MHDQTLRRGEGVVNNCIRLCRTNQDSNIANLTSALGVERCSIQNNLTFVTFT